MSAFSHLLPNGKTLTGSAYIPTGPSPVANSALPLIVAVHGAMFEGTYFNSDDKHSLLRLAESLQLPVIAIDRPGYSGTTPLETIPAESTFVQESGKYLNQVILPFLWEHYSCTLNTSSIFIWGDAAGAATTVVCASMFSQTLKPGYKLSGISLSSIGAESTPVDFEAFGDLFTDKRRNEEGLRAEIPNLIKTQMMFGPRSNYDPETLLRAEQLNRSAPVLELWDMNRQWKSYWHSYAKEITVPVAYTRGQTDLMWENSDEDVPKFVLGFSSAPGVNVRVLSQTPHCLIFSPQSTGFMLRTLGFAIETAVALKLSA